MDRVKETIAYLVWDAITNNVRVQFAGEPMKALGLILFFSIFLLPFVMVAALQPLVVVLNAVQYIGEKGLFTLIYTLCVKGVILSVLVVILYFVSFFVMSSSMIIITKYYGK